MAVNGIEDGVDDIWVHETGRPVKRRVTFDDAPQTRAVWEPTTDDLVFAMQVNGPSSLHRVTSDGRNPPTPFFAAPFSLFGFEWSQDGKYLVGSGPGDIWYLHQPAGQTDWEVVRFTEDRFDQVGPELSPDGKWIAYQSDETGEPQVWVRPFPEGDGKYLVSVIGGERPRWQGDGSELFYIEGDSMMAVPVTFAAEPRFSTPQRLFGGVAQRRGQNYDVSSDGRRFVMVEQMGTPEPPKIHVVLNWFEEFRGE